MARVWVCGLGLLLFACAGSAVAPVAPLPVALPALRTPSALALPTAQGSPTPLGDSATKPRAAAGLPPVVSQGDIGSAGPLDLALASSSGAWVAVCQGQPKQATLVLGSGTGEPIEDVLAQDPSGRYLVVQGGASAASLIDAVTQTRVDLAALGADVRRARVDYGSHRALSFSADGERLAYLRKQDQKNQLVVRQLSDGSEQSFALGNAEVFRLKLSADTRVISLELLREDTNHNNKLDWPTPEESSPKPLCQKPRLPKFRSYAYQGRGDTLTRAVLTLSDGSLRDVPELVTPLGQSLLVREADGSLRLEQAGKRAPLAPASCAGRVLFADAERGLVLVACSLPKKPGKRAVWLFGSGLAKDLASELYETSTDREAVTGVRLVPLYPGSEAALVDLQRRELLPLATGSRVLTVSGDTALLWRGSELYRYDARSKSETRIAQGVHKNPELMQAGGTVLLSPFVVLGDGGLAGKSPTERPLAVTAGGYVLAGSSATGGAGVAAGADVIQGPLHWLDARVPAPAEPVP